MVGQDEVERKAHVCKACGHSKNALLTVRLLSHITDSNYLIAYDEMLNFLSLPSNMRPFSILYDTSYEGRLISKHRLVIF